MRPWKAKVSFSDARTRVLIQDQDGSDALKAVLPAYPKHPRALLSLLEAIAAWEGSRISCVISVDSDFPRLREPDVWDIDFHTSGSASVSVEYAVPRGETRLGGLGDFRDVRALEYWGGS